MLKTDTDMSLRHLNKEDKGMSTTQKWYEIFNFKIRMSAMRGRAMQSVSVRVNLLHELLRHPQMSSFCFS